MILSVTLDRTSLALPALTIDRDPTQRFHLPENGVTEPDWQFRVTYAPESAYLPGQQSLAAVLDAGGLPLVVYAKGADAADLAAAKAELAAAVSQWRFDVTVNLDGQAATYPSAAPTWPAWGEVDTGMLRARMARASLTIPINPPTGG